MEIKESERYIEGVSFEGQGLYKDQIQLNKETEYIEGSNLVAQEGLYVNQIKKETDETGSIEIKESRAKFTESVSLEAQEEITDNEVELELELTPEGSKPELPMPEVLIPEGLMPTVLAKMPELCDVYAKLAPVINELPSTSNFEIPINNEDINLQTVDLTQPKELIELEEEFKEDIEMVDQIQTPELIKFNEPKEIEGVTLDAQKDLYNLESLDFIPEELIKLKVESKKVECVTLDVQGELYNLDTVDLTQENMIKLEVEPKEIEGVSLDIQKELYDLESVDLMPEELIKLKVESKKVEGVTLDVQGELYNLDTVDLTPEELIELKVKPKEVDGVSFDIKKELYNLDTVDLTQDLIELKVQPEGLESVSLDVQGGLYNLNAADLTPEEMIGFKAEPKEVQGVSLDVSGELYNLETIDLMAEELKVEAKDLESLYEDHEVIDDVVLGPVVLQQPDIMYTRQEVPIGTDNSWEIPIHYEMKEEPNIGYLDVVNFHAQSGYGDNDGQNELLGPERQAVNVYTKQAFGEGARWACSVTLERILVNTKRRTCRVGDKTYRLRGVIPRKKGFKFNLSKARLAIQNKLNNTNTHTGPQEPPPSKTIVVLGPRSKKSDNCESGYPPASNPYLHSIQARELPSKNYLVMAPQSKKSAKSESGYLPNASNAFSIPHCTYTPSEKVIVMGNRSEKSRPVKRRYNFKCYFCTETFKTKVSLIVHKSNVHCIKMFSHEIH